jgi:hypothetical protein
MSTADIAQKLEESSSSESERHGQPEKPDWEKSLRSYSRVLLAILVILIVGIIYHMFYQMPAMYKQQELKSKFREFWCGDSGYTSMYIIANLNNLPSLKYVGDRITQNYADMTQALITLHGLEAEPLFPLLQNHAAFVASLVDFRKNNGLQNSPEYQNMFLEWKSNAQLIAMTISGLRGVDHEKFETELYLYLEKISQVLEAELSNVPDVMDYHDAAKKQARVVADLMVSS